MKKGEIREGIVEAVKFPNKGLVRLFPEAKEHRTKESAAAALSEEAPAVKNEGVEYVTVKNVIPGQKLSLRITKVRKGKGEGRMLELYLL